MDGAAVRLKEQQGPLSSALLYVLYFLPTTQNTAWLSVASGLGVLVVPASYGLHAHMEACAIALAVAVTCTGERAAILQGLFSRLPPTAPALLVLLF